MNAPARINVPSDGLYEWSPAERAHRAAISIHCPNESADAMKCRVALAMIRDQAGVGMLRCSDDAHGVLAEVQRQATLAVYAPVGVGRLYLKKLALESLMQAARMIERAQR